jgi:hypothetical protein
MLSTIRASVPRFQQLLSVRSRAMTTALHLQVVTKPTPYNCMSSLSNVMSEPLNVQASNKAVPLALKTTGPVCGVCESVVLCDLCEKFGTGNVSAVFAAPGAVVTREVREVVLEKVSFVTASDLDKSAAADFAMDCKTCGSVMGSCDLCKASR